MKVGVPPPQCSCSDWRSFPEELGLHFDFPVEAFEVWAGFFPLLGDDLVAGAVVAEVCAEGDVDVERQGAVGLAAFGGGCLQVVYGEVFGEGQGRWV